MFSDGPKYAYKHLKLRKSCSFGNWSLSNGREYFRIATFFCKFIATCLPEKVKNSSEDWQNDIISWRRNTKWWTIELYKEKHVALLITGKLLVTTTAMATRYLTNLHIKQRKPVVKLCSCCFHWCTFRCCSRPFHDVKRPILQQCGRRQHMMTNFQIFLLISKPLI